MPLCGNAYKVSVTGFTFSVMWYDKHSADWLAALASPIRLRRTSPCSGGRINRSMLSCRDMAPWLSIHSPTTKWGEGGGASHQRGIAGVVHEVYDSLFFSSNSLFPLEGKCHVVAKGCTGQSNDVILYRYPDRQSAASLATSWSSPPLQAGGTRFNKCSCKGFCIRGRLL